MHKTSSVDADLLSPELCLDPHGLMHRIRREDPVYWSPQLKAWVLTSFNDISSVLRDDEHYSSASTPTRIDMMPAEQRQQLRQLRDSVALWMGHTSEEDHARFQQLLKKYFSHRMVEQILRPRAQAIANRLIDATSERRELDIANDLALPLSASVIAEMLGTPTEPQDIAQLRRWADDLSVLFRSRTFEDFLRIQRAVVEMGAYLRRFVEERRHERREDLISTFLDAEAEGNVRNVEEIVANCILLLFAGHESTAGLIANGTLLLMQHRDQLERLRREPELIPNAVEEMLRCESPTRTIYRQAAVDVELGGKKIAKNETICLMLAAGNRDPAVFPEPDRFDVARKMGRHLALGYGNSYCLGGPLARMETQVCFDTMLRRMPELTPRFDKPDWQPLPPFWCRLATLNIAF